MRSAVRVRVRATLCPLPLYLPSTVRLAPPSGRYVAVPRALLAAPFASTSTATATATTTRYLSRRRAVLIQPDPPPLMEALLPRRRLGVGGGGVQCGGARAEPWPAARGRRSAAVCRRHRLPEQRYRRRYVARRDGKLRYVARRDGNRMYVARRTGNSCAWHVEM